MKGSLLQNPRIRQSGMLYAVNLIGIPVGIGTSVFLTRYLGPEVFGDYKFILNVFTLSVILFSFGFFYAGNRAIVLNHNRERNREYYGALLITVLILSVLLSLVLLVYAGFDPNVEEKGLRRLFAGVVPFAGLFLLVRYFETLFQADNRIYMLSVVRFVPRLLLFLGVLMLWWWHTGDGGAGAGTGGVVTAGEVGAAEVAGEAGSDGGAGGAGSAGETGPAEVVASGSSGGQGSHALVWAVVFSTKAVVFAGVLLVLLPRFRNLGRRLREIWMFNKSYGLHVYAGSVFSVGLAQASGILISYFGTDNTGVGFYGLALMLASPLLFVPNVIATVYFRDFASMNRIPLKLTLITAGISAVALVALWVIVRPFVVIFYGEAFLPVVMLLYIVSSGVILHGLADYVNRFLGAHGSGKALRNGSILVGVSMLALNLLLIPEYGATGASVAKAVSGLLYLLAMTYYYRRLVSTLSPDGKKTGSTR